MTLCKSCGEVIIEGEGYCDSDKCLREGKEYEDFVAKNGAYCFECWQKGILPPTITRDVPFCPNCRGNSTVVPSFDSSGEQVGWVCLDCYWDKEYP